MGREGVERVEGCTGEGRRGAGRGDGRLEELGTEVSKVEENTCGPVVRTRS